MVVLMDFSLKIGYGQLSLSSMPQLLFLPLLFKSGLFRFVSVCARSFLDEVIALAHGLEVLDVLINLTVNKFLLLLVLDIGMC